MKQLISSTWTRMIVAFAAFFVIAGSGVVFATGANTNYPAPKYASIEGPASVTAFSGRGNYTLYVTFTDGSTANIVYPFCSFSVQGYTGASGGSFVGGTYHAGAAGRVSIQSTFTSGPAGSQGSVTASRAITVS